MGAADIVIVGGGTAGCILAARLSEQAHIKVVLLEAGRDIRAETAPADVRDAFPRAFANPDYFWPGVSAVMRGSEASRAFKQPRILGGGSSVMGLWAVRGLPSDYDGWGVPGWGYQDVLPYFKKLERDTDFSGHPHGSDGPIPLRRVTKERWPGFVARLAEAAASHQIPTRDDLNNGEETDGFFALPNSIGPDGRASSPFQYLTSAVRSRPNLEVRCDAHAAAIVFEGRRAVGVDIIGSDGLRSRIDARRVILSAGGIHSPAILMRSGVGPADDLAALGIAPVCDAPEVGRHLQNHLYVHMGALIRPGFRQSGAERMFAMAAARVSSRLPGCGPGDIFLSVMARTMARDPGNQIGVVGAHL
jgi:5-(hydroxymethyl)furfural/furfural oxidase